MIAGVHLLCEDCLRNGLQVTSRFRVSTDEDGDAVITAWCPTCHRGVEHVFVGSRDARTLAVKDDAYYRRMYEDCNGEFHPMFTGESPFKWAIVHAKTMTVFGYIGEKGKCFGVAAALNGNWEAAQVFMDDHPKLPDQYFERFKERTMESQRYRPPIVDPEGNVTFPPNDVDPLCDFCSRPEATPVAALLTKTGQFRSPELHLTTVSDGDWYVCRICLDLIVSRDFDRLTQRAVNFHLEKYGQRLGPVEQTASRVHLGRYIRELHSVALSQLVDWP